MKIFINEKCYTVGPFTHLNDIPEILGLPHAEVALAINQTIIHRKYWAATPLHEADRIDAFTVAAGG